MSLLSLLVVCALGVAAAKESQHCLSKGSPFYNLISTMTPYDDVRGDIKFKGCKAEAVWGYVRHATRYPHDDEIKNFSTNMTILRDQIIANHQEKRGSLCPDDLELLKRWHLVADPNQNMLLTTSGLEELRKFGERMGEALPFLKDLSLDQETVRITAKERTRQSAEAFFTGLLGRHLRIDNSFIHDVLKVDGKCAAWDASTKNDKLKEEVQKFKKSNDFSQVASRVSKRLGFKRILDFDTVKDMYDVCGFEYAWYHSSASAPWCAAFTPEDLQVMEFFEDLRYFYKSAMGNPLTPKVGCPLIKEMVQLLTEGSGETVLNFGHSVGVRILLTTLGVASEEQLSGDGYKSGADRDWRSSKLTPFAANVLAVRYKCKKGSYGVSSKRRVAVLVNESPVQLAACGGVMCSLEDFARALAPLTRPDFCNRDFCGTASTDIDTDQYDKD